MQLLKVSAPRKIVSRCGVLAAAALAVALLLPASPAQAAQWNSISQTLNGTNWTTENYVRTVTTNHVNFDFDLQNLPGCCLDLRFRSNSTGLVFGSKYNMQTIKTYPDIVTNVLSGTRFNVEGRNSVSGSDRYWAGRLYY